MEDIVFATDDRVIVVGNETDKTYGLRGHVVAHDQGVNVVIVELDEYPGMPFGFHPDELDYEDDYVNEELVPPPFGMDAEDFSDYMDELLYRLEDQAHALDTSANRGYQRWEGADFGEVIQATLGEVEQVILGSTMLHAKLARILVALNGRGIA